MAADRAGERIIHDVVELLGDEVGTTLWAHGWGIQSAEESGDDGLVWYWPPTASADIERQVPAETPGGEARTEMIPSPWTDPTRITRQGRRWRVDYGSAVAQSPDHPTLHATGRDLLADLDRIEWWPMRPNEARRLRAMRVVEITMARARGDHYRDVPLTEPYASRLSTLRERQSQPRGRVRRQTTPAPPPQHGDLHAQAILVEAAAWVSALRTFRAGGQGSGVIGQE